jgi:hypothetical protein
VTVSARLGSCPSYETNWLVPERQDEPAFTSLDLIEPQPASAGAGGLLVRNKLAGRGIENYLVGPLVLEIEGIQDRTGELVERSIADLG